MISDNDTLGRVHRAGKKLDFAGGAVAGRNPVKDKPYTVVQALMEAPPNTEPESSVEEEERDLRDELEIDIAMLLSDLTKTEMRVVRLIFMEGYSLREAEAELGISKSELHRMTQRLKPRLETILRPILERKYPQ